MTALQLTQLGAAWRSALRSEPQLPFEEWALHNIRNADGSQFKFRPYQVVAAADLFNPRVASVALRQFSGAGKTYLLAIAYAYAVHQLKLQVGKLFPAENLTADFFLKKLMPILKATPCLEAIPMTKDNALYKAWENGSTITGVGANSGGRIRTLEVDVCDADEIDAITEEISDEGNKLAAFLWRSRGRKRQHHWISSYPSRKGHSKIDAAMDQSDLCKWYYECCGCGQAIYWETKHIKWADDPSKAVAECPECAATFGDARRVESIEETGHWRNRDGERVEAGDLPSDQYGRRRGLHLNAMAHVGAHADKFADYLHEIATAKINADAAENPRKARRVLVNTVDAESYEDELGEKADAGELEEAREHYDPAVELPDGVTRIYGGVDVNDRFLNFQAWGFGENDAWSLHYEQIDGRYSEPKVWARLLKLIAKAWRHPLGVDVHIRKTYVDSRFKLNSKDGDSFKGVQRWCKGKRRVRAVVGSPTKGAPAIGKEEVNKLTGALVRTLGPSELKDTVYDWLSPDIETKMQVHFTDATDEYGQEMFDAEFFAGLLAEDRDEVMYGGRMVPVFTHDRSGGGPRNEPLDTAAYLVAAWMADRESHAHARATLEARAEEAKGDKPKPKRKPKRNQFNPSGKPWLTK